MSRGLDHGHFNAVATDYRACRPSYPDALFEWIAAKAPNHDLCWDVGCGNGQASLGLASLFASVEASDVNPEQIRAAIPHPRIRYRIAEAETSDLDDCSVDAAVVAAAIQWLDVPRFNREVTRVLKPGGLLVWVGYHRVQGAPSPLQGWLDQLDQNHLNPWWPPERRHVRESYAHLPFPGPSQTLPPHWTIQTLWTQQQLLGFIGTWSALRCAGSAKCGLLSTLGEELAEIWPPGQLEVRFELPLFGRWGLMP